MSRHHQLLEQMRSANPVPDPDQTDPDELSVVHSLISEGRAGAATTAQRERRDRRLEPPRYPRLRPAAVFVTSLVLALAGIGVTALILRGNENQPPATSTPVTTATSVPETTPPTSVTSEPPPAVFDFVWARLPHDDAVFGDGSYAMSVFDLAYGHDTWLAVGRYDAVLGPDIAFVDRGAVLISPDGIIWERVTGHPDLDFGEFPWWDGGPIMRAAAATDRGFVVVGVRSLAGPEQGEPERSREAAVWTSADGRNWSAIPYDPAIFGGGQDDPASMVDVVAVGDQVIAVGQLADAAAVWLSPDGGRSWSLATHAETAFGRRDTPDEQHDGDGDGVQAMYSVARGSAGFVSVGVDGNRAAAWMSEDGLTWSRVSPDQAAFVGEGALAMSDVVAVASGYVAVGTESIVTDGDPDSRAAAWFSPDGMDWIRITHDPAVFGGYPEDLVMSAVAAGPDGIVAVGSSGRDDEMRGVVWTSSDGIAWRRITDGPVFSGRNGAWIGDVMATGEGFIAVGAEMDDTDWMYGGYAAVWVTNSE